MSEEKMMLNAIQPTAKALEFAERSGFNGLKCVDKCFENPQVASFAPALAERIAPVQNSHVAALSQSSAGSLGLSA